MSEKVVEGLKNWSVIVGIIAGVGGMAIGLFQLRADSMVHSGEFLLKLRENFEAPKYKILNDALSGTTTTTIRGRFTDVLLEDYLGKLETVGNFYREGLVVRRMAYDEFSYDVEKAYCNQDVQAHIQKIRKGDKSPIVWFEGFEMLGKVFLETDHYTCKDVDKI